MSSATVLGYYQTIDFFDPISFCWTLPLINFLLQFVMQWGVKKICELGEF
jgi:hypothetical protein